MGRALDLDHIFTYHRPSDEQVVYYTALRKSAKQFAEAIVGLVPAGPDQSAAVRLVRDALMTANAGVALDGRLHVEE